MKEIILSFSSLSVYLSLTLSCMYTHSLHLSWYNSIEFPNVCSCPHMQSIPVNANREGKNDLYSDRPSNTLFLNNLRNLVCFKQKHPSFRFDIKQIWHIFDIFPKSQVIHACPRYPNWDRYVQIYSLLCILDGVKLFKCVSEKAVPSLYPH